MLRLVVLKACVPKLCVLKLLYSAACIAACYSVFYGNKFNLVYIVKAYYYYKYYY